jgi:hypothetical protein
MTNKMTSDDYLQGSSEVRYFLDIYFSMYACHFERSCTREKFSLSVQIPLTRTKFGKRIPLPFPLKGKIKGKLRDFPIARNSLLSRVLLLRLSFP